MKAYSLNIKFFILIIFFFILQYISESGWTGGFGSDLTDLSFSSTIDVDEINDLSLTDVPPVVQK